MRLAISAAPALVKVRHNIASGSAPFSKQAEHPPCQDLGLSRTGGCRHGRVHVGIDGGRLRALQHVGNGLNLRAISAALP